MDIKEFVGVAGIPIVIGLVQAIKVIFPNLEARFYPAVALLWAEVLNLSLAYILHLDYATSAVVGVVVALGACGFFQYGKNREYAP